MSFEKKSLAMKPKLVIFDFDGVLVDTQKSVNKLEWEHLSRDGLEMILGEFTKRFSGHTAFSIVKNLVQNKALAVSKPIEQYVEDIDEFVLAQLSHQGVRPIKGVKKVLQKLSVKKCIASNCSLRILRILLSASTLDTYFNGNVFSADMVENPNPSPELFLYAAFSMRINPNNCLVIEDSEVGVQAACAAGIKVWGFLGGSHMTPESNAKLLRAGAERTFGKMEDLLLFLGKENAMLMPQKDKKIVPDFITQRANMVKFQLQARGIKDKRVLEAMNKVPRHLFVPEDLRNQAYADSALPIGYDQTISQPYIVALMCEAAVILPQDKVLEIGTGSGYQAAILSQLTQKVHTVEIVSPLGKHARQILKELNYNNVYVKIGDGYSGWPEHAPYNVILITAATEKVPQPLIDQLALKGRLIMPLGSGLHQELIRFIKTEKGLKKESLGSVVFVPFQRTPL